MRRGDIPLIAALRGSAAVLVVASPPLPALDEPALAEAVAAVAAVAAGRSPPVDSVAPPAVAESPSPDRPLVISAAVEDRGFALSSAALDAPRPGPARLVGAPTLVTLAVAWCGPCLAELAEVVELAKDLGRDRAAFAARAADPATRSARAASARDPCRLRAARTRASAAWRWR